MPDLKGSKTHQNLQDAFASESTGNPRYLYFAKVADREGYPEVAGKIRDTELNLKAAVAGETHEFTDMYPGIAKTAREEGFEEISDWFETLTKAEKSRAGRFVKMLASIR